MLKHLHIKNIILIKEIQVDLQEGFSVFTGETGSGKSILLDSLALSLGDRANFSFIRKNEEIGEITAIFHNSHPKVIELLKENSIAYSTDEIIIRRVMDINGKSRGFINDTPVSVNFLRTIGSMLIDIHGQFDNQRLMNPSMHREILDSFLTDKKLALEVEKLFNEFTNAKVLYIEKQQEVLELEKEREYIEYSLQEILDINPQLNEEDELLKRKSMLSNAKKINNKLHDINDTLINSAILVTINKAIKQIESLKDTIEDEELNNLSNLVEIAYTNLSDSIDTFVLLRQSLVFDERELSEIEDRLINLRSMVRKHRVASVNDLITVRDQFNEKLSLLQTGGSILDNYRKDYEQKYALFKDKAEQLSQHRQQIAIKLDEKVNKELTSLKLNDAGFKTFINHDNEGSYGLDKVIFKVKTNKGSDFADLNKIASGGEMARFMLALKIVFTEVDIISTLMLDEIDIGVGGEVAEAIGKRLAKLSERLQVIVVTHSHQVASQGIFHYKIVKKDIDDYIETKLLLLSKEERIEEIARMLAGAEITEEARATAVTLLKGIS